VKIVKGKVWSGYIGECKQDKRCPCYIIRKPQGDGVFLCDILKKFARKEVIILITPPKKERER